MRRIVLTLTMISCAISLYAQTAKGVLSTARKVNGYFMEKYADPTLPTNVKKIRSSNLWTRAVYYEGLMALYAIDPAKAYLDYTDRWASFHQWTARGGIEACNADNQCCQQTYLIRYQQAPSEEKIVHVKANLDYQMQTKIGWWTWIDAIQMAMPVYSKMYKITGERRYIDHAMKMYTWTRDTLAGGLFNEKEGLWWRDKDFVPPYKEKDGHNCYWSRGNGWVYATYVRVMSDLDRHDPYYKQLRKDYLRMTKALLRCQREDGLWNVSLVSPVTFGGKELSGPSLFLYGLAWGIREGLLKEKKYRPVCDRIWQGMETCVHDDGCLGWVQGTGKQPSDGQPLAFDKLPDFEDYGTGCFLLGATEYYQLLKRP